MYVNNKLRFSLLLFIGLTVATLAPAVGQVPSTSPDPTSYGMTSGRLVATLAAVIALVGAVAGGWALARPGTIVGRSIAIIAGLIGTIVGGLRIATASGIGTGGGRAGAIVALVLGLVAIALGGLALPRFRRNG
jgi:hypothetical protein